MLNTITVTTIWQELTVTGRYKNNSSVGVLFQRSDTEPESSISGIYLNRYYDINIPDDGNKYWIKTTNGETQLIEIFENIEGSSIVDANSGKSVTINELGQMHVVLRGLTDEGNSTSDLLLANETFTGIAKEILDYVEIAVAVYSDKDSSINGLTIEFSPDGEEWFTDGQSMSVYGENGKTFSFQPERAYYRIKYLNGDVDQTSFNIETTLRKTRAKPSSHNINKMISVDDDAELTKSVLTASLDNSNDFVNIGAHLSADGDYHLSVSTVQNSFIDPNNSTDDNLTSDNSYTFIGTSTTTVGASGIQWLLKTDQNAIVYVDQSSDGINWDISNNFDYYYSKGGDAITVKSMTAYYRIRVILTGSLPTTYFRLSSKLVPISEPLPESLDNYGRLKTNSGIIDTETGNRVSVEPLGSLKTVSPVRLVGTPFNNGTKDPNFWVETTTGSGLVTQSGEIILSTGTTLLSSAKYISKIKARKVTGTTNQFRAVGRLTTSLVENNIRSIGAYDTDNGFYFRVNGTVLTIGSRKNGVDTDVTSGYFNGNYGTDVIADENLKRFVIEYTSVSARFFINDILLHTISSSSNAITNSLDLPITMENYNLDTNIIDSSFQIRFATILRLGELITNPITKGIIANGTYVLKYGSGVLQRIINTDNAGTIDVYDGITTAGDFIADIDATKALGTLEFGAPFSNGLTIVSAGNARFTVIYE